MAFARVQGNSASANAVTLSAVGSGGTVLGAYCFDATIGTFTTITDNQGNTYTVTSNILDTTNNQRTIFFALGNITNAPTTITINGAGTNIFQEMVVDEFSGGDTATNNRDGATGQFQATPGTGTDAITSGAIVTTQGGDLIWGAMSRQADATLPSVGTGFTAGTGATAAGYAMRSEFLTQGSAGSIAATFTQASASPTVTAVVAIKAPAAAAVPYVFQDLMGNENLIRQTRMIAA